MCDSHPPEKSFVDPTGRYELTVETIPNGKDRWAYTRGTVRLCSAPHSAIATVERNYPDFWHSWVKHSNGRDYMLCGENYQGYTVVDLSRATVRSYLPEAAARGEGFCWASATPSPSATRLAVEGCFWGGPYMLAIYDFADPDSIPLPEPWFEPTGILGTLSDYDLTWKDENSLAMVLRPRYNKEDWKKDCMEEIRDCMENGPEQQILSIDAAEDDRVEVTIRVPVS